MPGRICWRARRRKIGKSFLVAQLAYHVSTGQTLWDYPVRQGGVLYLALEDDFQRLQGRMSRMFGVEGTDNLHFAITSAQIGLGLVEQLNNFLGQSLFLWDSRGLSAA